MKKHWFDDVETEGEEEKAAEVITGVFVELTPELLEQHGRLYTPEEAAQYFRLTVDTIYRWTSKKKIGFFKLTDGTLRISQLHMAQKMNEVTAKAYRRHG